MDWGRQGGINSRLPLLVSSLSLHPFSLLKLRNNGFVALNGVLAHVSGPFTVLF